MEIKSRKVNSYILCNMDSTSRLMFFLETNVNYIINDVNKNNENYTVHGDLMNLFCGERYKSVVRAIKTFQKYRQLCNNFECISFDEVILPLCSIIFPRIV